MKNAKLLTAAALAGILSFAATQAIAADKPAADEKCYGVAKSGKNDCHAGSHSCAGHTAAADGDKAEWIFMPKGLCEKLVGGSLSAPAAMMDKEKAPEMKNDMKTDGKM